MKYDLIITNIDKSHINTVAKLLCIDPSISLQKALSMLNNPPVVYRKNLEKVVLKREMEKLKSLGADVVSIESKNVKDEIDEILDSEEIIPSVEKKEVNKAPIKKVENKLPKSDHSERKSHSSNISRIRPSAKPKKKKNFTGLIVLIGFIVVVLLLFSQGNKDSKYDIKADNSLVKKVGVSKNGKSSSSDKQKKRKSLNVFSAMKEKKKKEEAKKINESKNYSDSAELFLNDPNEMIRFYKIAISINEKNFNAWTGLVNAYANLGMTKEAFKAKEEMAKIFGKEMFSVEDIVKPYGKLVSYKRDRQGFCRLEYKSKSKKRVLLESESFNLLRSLSASQNCGKYSLYASTGKGKGMLVRFSHSEFPNTFSNYLLKAEIHFIE